MASWRPHSCDCYLEFSRSGNLKEYFVRFIKKCKIHNTVDEVLSHEQSINYKHGIGKKLTKFQMDDIEFDLANEKQRIRKL